MICPHILGVQQQVREIDEERKCKSEDIQLSTSSPLSSLVDVVIG
jgi:hypothetical protein